MTQIIGVCQIRNEEHYIERIITNIHEFCDRIIVLDNNSGDQTPVIVSRMAVDMGMYKIDLYSLVNLGDALSHITEYIGTDTWIFGVDGDEIYAPADLAKLRGEIMSGQYDKYWMIRGNFLHAVGLNIVDKTATGYLGPPSKEGVKLYNFNALQSWKQEGKRPLFMSKTQVFKPGFGSGKNYYRAYEHFDWDDSYIRCLHIRFIERSRFDKPVDRVHFKNIRKNPVGNEGTRENYRRGELVTKDVSSFFV